jgi:hypothetical protein
MKGFGIAAAACALALSAVLTAPAAAQSLRDAPDPQEQSTLPPSEPPPERSAAPARSGGGRYFIEFRSRSALSYGHTFVVFGRVGERLTAKNVAGLHPKGDSTVTYLLGHILMVPAETGVSDGDLDLQYTTARYRIFLSAADYHNVVAKIRHLQANSPTWNAATYNCNAFAGTVAHFVGLVSPPTWLLPADFINSMRRMNEPAGGGDRRRTPATAGARTPCGTPD